MVIAKPEILDSNLDTIMDVIIIMVVPLLAGSHNKSLVVSVWGPELCL